MADTTIKVAFIGDTRDFARATSRVQSDARQVQSSFAKMSTGVKDFGKVATFALGGAGLAVLAFSGTAIDAASDVNEALSKNKVLFGESAAEIEKFADTAARSFGLSRREALAATGDFGALARSFGITETKSAKLSTGLVGIAADLASFNNADTAEVITALRAGLVGETEPLRRFGITLSAARVEAEALLSGIATAPIDLVKVEAATVALDEAQRNATRSMAKYGAESLQYRKAQSQINKAQSQLNKAMRGTKIELTAAEKAQATYNLIMADAALAAGDFERTSDGVANRQRILKAELENVKEEIGQQLLPIYEKLLRFLSTEMLPFVRDKIVPAFAVFADWVRDRLPEVKRIFEAVFGGGQKLIEDLAGAFNTNKSTIIAAIGGIGAALIGLAIAWNLGPGVIITGIVALVAGFLYLYNESEDFRKAMQVTFFLLSNWIRIQMGIISGAISAATTVFELFGTAWSVVWDTVVRIWQGVKSDLQPILAFLEKLVDVAGGVVDVLGKIRDVGGGKLPIPLPGGGVTFLAAGGIVTKPTLAMVGEAGPEAVIPLNSGYSIGGGGVTVIIQGDVNTEIDFERKVRAALASTGRRGG